LIKDDRASGGPVARVDLKAGDEGPIPLPDRNAHSPLEGFVHDVDYTRFDTRFGRLVPIGLAGLVAWVAYEGGVGWALAIGGVIAIVLVVVVIALERDRWRAQDVLHWFQAGRMRTWLHDTGGISPNGDPAAAEIWLGVHQPGSVPHLYRAIVAAQTGDRFRFVSELAAVPEATPTDRAMKAWLVESLRWTATGEADAARVRALADEVPDPTVQSALNVWLASVAAARRRSQGDRGWIAPMVAGWAQSPRYDLGWRRRSRLWLSRFVVVLVFAVSSVVFSSVGLTLAERQAAIPADDAKTTYAIRGDLPGFDEERMVHVLPALARAIPAATRIGDAALSDDAFDRLTFDDVPTFIWATGPVDIAAPADAPGRRVWEIEVLLGGSADTASSAIVTFDDASGPRNLYRIDPVVVAALREAAGLPAR
jgi:hypothetical protein